MNNANKHSLQRAESLDSLNVREMADLPEIDIDKMEDKEVTERFYREWQQCGQKAQLRRRNKKLKGIRLKKQQKFERNDKDEKKVSIMRKLSGE